MGRSIKRVRDAEYPTLDIIVKFPTQDLPDGKYNFETRLSGPDNIVRIALGKVELETTQGIRKYA